MISMRRLIIKFLKTNGEDEMKKLLCCVMAFMLSVTPVFASEKRNNSLEDNSTQMQSIDEVAHSEDDGYFKFINPNSRITSKGAFTYEFYVGLSSDKFKLKSGATSTTISFDEYWSTGSGTISVTLYKGLGTSLGTKTYSAGYNASLTWTDLKDSDTYYFKMSNSDSNAAAAGRVVSGSGSISNFGSVK